MTPNPGQGILAFRFAIVASLVLTIFFVWLSATGMGATQLPSDIYHVPESSVNSVRPDLSVTRPVDIKGPLAPNSSVLFDQFTNPSPQLVSSQNFEPVIDTFDSQAADDFTVASGQTWTIDKVEVSGAYKNSAWADSVNVFFYANASGLPGTPVYSYTNVLPESGLESGNFVIDISPPLHLNADVWWVSVQANEDLVQTNQWYWRDRLGGAYNNAAAWRNPGFGYGRCANWGHRGADCHISTDAADQIFRIYGTAAQAQPTSTGTPPTATPSNTPQPPPPTRTGTQQAPPPPIVTIVVPVDTNTPQPPTPTPAACGTLSNYTYQQTSGATIVPGTILLSGSQCDYCTVRVTIPFTYNFYDGAFSSAELGSNGALAFTSNNNWDQPACLPYTYLVNSIVATWADLSMDPFMGADLGIYTSTSGVAPNRIFNIEWRACVERNGACSRTANFEVRLYENSARFDLIYATPLSFYSTIGVQRDQGEYDLYTQYQCTIRDGVAAGTQLTFTQASCGSPSPTATGTPPTLTPTRTPTRAATRTPLPTFTFTPTSTFTPTPQACGLWWRYVASPNGPGTNDTLLDVATITPNDIWAVGSQFQDNRYNALFEHWNGSAWSVVPGASVPDQDLRWIESVSASGTDDVWAVGNQTVANNEYTLIQHWDGNSWSVVPSPSGPANGASYLMGVAAIAPDNAWAVGYTIMPSGTADLALILHWDGSTWTSVAAPNGPEADYTLEDIAAVTPNDIWAVGEFFNSSGGNTLVEHWNGSVWSLVSSPNEPGAVTNYLSSVAVVSANDVWAVGRYSMDISESTFRTLTLHWNGSAWSRVGSPNPAGPSKDILYDVTATGADDLWAVGQADDQTLAMHYQGGAWTLIDIQGAGSSAAYYGIEAVSGTDVWAVGSSNLAGGSTLISRYSDPCATPTATATGTLPTSTPSHTRTNTPTPSSPSPTRTHTFTPTPFPTDTPTPFTPTLTPTATATCRPAVSLVSSPNQAGDNMLFSVSELNSNDVWAVGANRVNGISHALTMHWNGSAWSIVPTTAPDTSVLRGVWAESANNAWAVGYYITAGNEQTLIMHWNGSTWSIAASPNDGVRNFLFSIDGISANDIWTVGFEITNAGNMYALAIHWDGATWSVTPTPTFGIVDLAFYSVHAIETDDVWAVGSQGFGGTPEDMVMRWDGSQWTTIPGVENNEKVLRAVTSFTSDQIWAAGYQAPVYNRPIPVTLSGNRFGWGNSPNPVTDELSWLAGLTRLGNSDGLLAVGTRFDGTMNKALLERLQNNQWSVLGVPAIAGEGAYLYGASSLSYADGWTVGSYQQGGMAHTLILHYTDPCPAPPSPTITPIRTRTSTPLPATFTATPTTSPTTSPTLTPGQTLTRTPTQLTATVTTTPTTTGTRSPTSTQSGTPQPSQTPTLTPIGTRTITTTPSVTPTVCAIQFTDVLPGSTFYDFVRCMACRGIINGYASGCETGDPCFRPNNNVTRGQLSKIVANAAGFNEAAGAQQYEDVPPGSTFYDFVWRLANRGFVTGYPCGGPGEPCSAANLPYFRPNGNATRGQISKIDANAAGFNDTAGAQQYEDVLPGSTFYDFIYRLSSRGIISGYPCGGATEPCGPNHLPYFRPNANATRGQASKIVSNTFFPGCQP